MPISVNKMLCSASKLLGVQEEGDLSQKKGRGVVALEDLKAMQIIEVAPAIWCSELEYKSHLRFTVFEEYLFKCKSGNYLCGLGFASLFNHSASPNVSYEIDEANRQILFRTCKKVRKGEFLSIWYGEKLWFGDKDEESEESREDGDGLPFF